jgi:hypothetical protein
MEHLHFDAFGSGVHGMITNRQHSSNTISRSLASTLWPDATSSSDNRAVAVGVDDGFHLHRLDAKQRVAGLHAVA